MKVVVRLKGGLGNQLFCYAAARRLAHVNDAELVIDCVTGFSRDYLYRRNYALSNFNINARMATPAERLEPFERYRRGVAKWLARRKPFVERAYIEQEGIDFDERVLRISARDSIYLDGLWQSERYFKDVEPLIRSDLRIQRPQDSVSLSLADRMASCESVAVHVRWFSAPGADATHNVSVDYYRRAISVLETRIASPTYFLFSDDPEAARQKLQLPDERLITVEHNRGDDAASADLWLMTQCRHFVIANSTFSWWGAWLAQHEQKIIIAPSVQLAGLTAWGFPGQLPDEWIKL